MKQAGTDLFKKPSFRCRKGKPDDPGKTYGNKLGLETKCTKVPGPRIKPVTHWCKAREDTLR